MIEIEDVVKKLPSSWIPSPALTTVTENVISNRTSKDLPHDFLKFHELSDGGEGKLKDIYLTLWPLADVEKLTKEYGFQEHMKPTLIAVGTTDDAFLAFDFTDNLGKWVVFPFGDFDLEELCEISTSFADTLVRFIDNRFPKKAADLLLQANGQHINPDVNREICGLPTKRMATSMSDILVRRASSAPPALAGMAIC